MSKQLILLFCLVCVGFSSSIFAGDRFISNHSCSDAQKVCVSSGARTVDGFEVSRPCWEWSYVKICNYPSKNNCGLYEHCYAVANRECLLQDSLGNCVNLKREFSCKSWINTQKDNTEARVDLVEKDGKEGIICKGVPCIDGNCVDKSYLTNGEMMDSVSKLYATSNMKPDKDHNFNLFAGFGNHCSKKPTGYSNCCPNTSKGWGKQLGAKCTKDEISLINLREKKLCVSVGKTTTKKIGIPTVMKHHYCCFGNILERVIQVEGRKQLGITFGSGGSPNCRGLTIEEIQRLDFSKMDFTDFINELMVKFTGNYKTPNPNEIASTMKAHMNIKEYDGDENNPDNKFAGLNQNIQDDSWEAQEERRVKAEQLEREHSAKLAQIEAEKQVKAEQERLAKIEEKKREKERQIKIAQELRRGHLANLKKKKAVEFAEVNNALPVEERQSLYYWKVSPTHHYQLSKLRISFLGRSKARLEKELQEIEAEFSNNILLPEQLVSKRAAKQSELNIAKAGVAKAKNRADKDLPYYQYYILEEQLYQQEVNSLEKELLEEAY
jgi:conjugal transfer mating pair stabilization protein TraN